MKEWKDLDPIIIAQRTLIIKQNDFSPIQRKILSYRAKAEEKKKVTFMMWLWNPRKTGENLETPTLSFPPKHIILFWKEIFESRFGKETPFQRFF